MCKIRTSGFVCSKVSPLIKDSKHIVSVLGRDYSSTWPRLLQYLMEITAVLGPSTGAHILRYEPYVCSLEF